MPKTSCRPPQFGTEQIKILALLKIAMVLTLKAVIGYAVQSFARLWYCGVLPGWDSSRVMPKATNFARQRAKLLRHFYILPQAHCVGRHW
jgi:hypothetical protein